MLLPGSSDARFLSAAVMRAASALVTPVTLDVLYMKLERDPLPLTNVARAAVAPALPAAAAGVLGVVAAAAAALPPEVLVLPPPPSLQLPGSLLLLAPACCADCGACGVTQDAAPWCQWLEPCVQVCVAFS